jgi:Rieske Fe-S protein
LDRRRFVKHFALSSAASIIGGKLWTARLLADIGPYGEPIGRIPIKLSDYPALQEEYGSVQFKFTASTESYYPFTLTRAPENQFFAVDTRCTHAGCIVDVFTTTSFSMVCQCHGSEYNYMGQVVLGPAFNDLLPYTTTFDGIDTITVFVPGLDMKINTVSVQSSTSNTIRVKLQFPTMFDGRYRIQFRQELNDLPQDLLFTTAAIGTPDLEQIIGTGQEMTVYVDAALPRGFFSVALVVDLY